MGKMGEKKNAEGLVERGGAKKCQTVRKTARVCAEGGLGSGLKIGGGACKEERNAVE